MAETYTDSNHLKAWNVFLRAPDLSCKPNGYPCIVRESKVYPILLQWTYGWVYPLLIRTAIQASMKRTPEWVRAPPELLDQLRQELERVQKLPLGKYVLQYNLGHYNSYECTQSVSWLGYHLRAEYLHRKRDSNLVYGPEFTHRLGGVLGRLAKTFKPIRWGMMAQAWLLTGHLDGLDNLAQWHVKKTAQEILKMQAGPWKYIPDGYPTESEDDLIAMTQDAVRGYSESYLESYRQAVLGLERDQEPAV